LLINSINSRAGFKKEFGPGRRAEVWSRGEEKKAFGEPDLAQLGQRGFVAARGKKGGLDSSRGKSRKESLERAGGIHKAG